MDIINATALQQFMESAITTQIAVILFVFVVVLLVVALLMRQIFKQQGEQAEKQLSVIQQQQQQHNDALTEFRRTNDALYSITDTMRSQQKTLAEIGDDVTAIPGKLTRVVNDHDTVMESRVDRLGTLVSQGFSEQKTTLNSILEELRELRPQVVKHSLDGVSLEAKMNAIVAQFEKLVTSEHPAVEVPPAIGD